jgi:hypothetical protein
MIPFASMSASPNQPLMDSSSLVSKLLGKSNVLIRKSAIFYSDASWLTGERLVEKRQVIDAPGARFASASFVTGALDRVASRTDFLALAVGAAVPTLLVYGAETPSRSRSEMEALAALPGVRSERLSRGKLSIHEEFHDDVSAVVTPFLSQ